MGKLIIFLFCITILGETCLSQDRTKLFFERVHKGDSLYQKKRYLEAAQVYSTAFRNKEGFSINMYRLLCAYCWDKANFPDSAIVNLNILVYAMKFSEPQTLKTYFGSSPLRNSEAFKKVLDRSLLNERVNKLPYMSEVAKILENVYVQDQSTRSLKNDSSIKNNVDILSIQLSNLNLIDSLYSQYGLLASSQVGEKGALAQFLVIQHSNVNIQKKWLPRMQRAVKNGVLVPENLCLLIDRIRVQSGRRQLYGTQLLFSSLKKCLVPYPIKNIKKVDQRRYSLGMVSLQQYIATSNN